MAMDFVFAKEIDRDHLHQGDLLLKTEDLRGVLSLAHSFYAEADDYTHFVVLTQSCDLVRRKGKCRASYITLAAVRPLETLVRRRMDKIKEELVEFPLNVCPLGQRHLINQFLERLLHNTEDSYFFIRKGAAESVSRDLCAFLVLSVALRKEHYDVCLSAKRAQLEDIFAAKLGWLTGNLYSRVATPDLEEVLGDEADEYKSAFFDDAIDRNVVWLSPMQIRELKKRVKQWKRGHPGGALTAEEARALLNRLPDDIELVAERAVAVLQELDFIERTEEVSLRARTALSNDASFKKRVASTAR